MSKYLLSLFVAFCLRINSQTIDTIWLAKNYTKQEVLIPMRDGVKLFTAIYAPKDE